MNDRKVEVIVVVEGVEASTGGTVQARHSYTVDDMEWNHAFPPCVYEDHDGAALIDFSVFHQLEKVNAVDPEESGGFTSLS